MTGIVPARRVEMTDGIVVGGAVTGSTWQQLAGLTNWLRGKGAVLVPYCTPFTTIAAAASETFRFRVKTRSSAIQRVWVVTMSGVGGTASVQLQAPGTGGTVVDAAISDERTTVVYVENLSSRSGAEQQIEFEVNCVAGSNSVVVSRIACYEQDRPVLQSDSTDYGVDLFTCASGQPIYDGANVSVGGVYDALVNADARRVGIFHWTQGDSTAAATASGTPADLLQLAVPVLVRKLARSATTGSVKWAAYAKVTAGTGTITLTHTNNAGTFTDSASVTGTSYAWTSARTVSNFDCDDLDVADGRQSSTWDSLNFQISASGGTLTVQSISVWQDD